MSPPDFPLPPSHLAALFRVQVGSVASPDRAGRLVGAPAAAHTIDRALVSVRPRIFQGRVDCPPEAIGPAERLNLPARAEELGHLRDQSARPALATTAANSPATARDATPQFAGQANLSAAILAWQSQEPPTIQ